LSQLRLVYVTNCVHCEGAMNCGRQCCVCVSLCRSVWVCVLCLSLRWQFSFCRHLLWDGSPFWPHLTTHDLARPVHLGQRPDWLSHIPWSDMAPAATDCGGWGWHDVRTAPSRAGISEDIVLFVIIAAFATYAYRHIVTIRYDSWTCANAKELRVFSWTFDVLSSVV